MNPKQLEVASRKLCVLRGLNPDDVVLVDHQQYPRQDVYLAPYNAPQWQVVSKEIIKFSELQSVCVGLEP